MNTEIKENYTLQSLTTFKIGGPAEYFAVAQSEEELVLLISEAKKNNWPITILGGGSNVLIADEGLKGLVIMMAIGGVEYLSTSRDLKVTAGAGVEWDTLVSDTVAKNFWGLENLSAIPGLVGATPIQNVGAYGVEVADLIEEVKVYDKEKEEFKVLNNTECKFSYRNSIFKSDEGKDFIVTSVTYKLSETPQPKLSYRDLALKYSDATEDLTVSDIRQSVIDIRSAKFPNWKEVGTAGSFFKNPIVTGEHFAELQAKYEGIPGFPQGEEVKVPLGWILDKVCHLRGYTEGNVSTYNNQALVIINKGDATYSEVESFADTIAEKVFAETKIKVEWEVTSLKN